MADSYTWISTDGGDWAVASNWRDITTGDNPAVVAPGVNDFASVSGRTDGAFQIISGQGNAASLTTSGNLILGGLFGVGTLLETGTLDVNAGATLTAGSATLNGALQVSGAGALLGVNGPLQIGTASPFPSFGSVLNITNGAKANVTGVMTLNSGTLQFDSTGLLEIGVAGTATPGSFVIDPGMSVSGSGQIVGNTTTLANPTSIIDNGTIIATGGLRLTTPISGTGHLQIAAGAGLSGLSTVGPGLTIDFLANTGNLQISQNFSVNAVAAGITGFQQGDIINIGTTANSATYASTGPGVGTLTVKNNGVITTTLKLLGDYTNSVFVTNPSGGFGTDISIAYGNNTGAGSNPPSVGTAGNDSYTWISTIGGDWGAASNWQDITAGANPAVVAPGSNNLASVSGRTDGAFQIISGQGNAASLTTSGNLILGGLFGVGTLLETGTLDVNAGATLTAGSATLNGALQVSGAGALLGVNGPLQIGTASPFPSFGSVLNITNGAKANVTGVMTLNSGTLQFDSTGLLLLVAGFSGVRIRLKPAEMADYSAITRTGAEYVLIADQNGKKQASVMYIERN